MPPKITHNDGFEISLSHQDEWLTIYDNGGVSDDSQAETSKPTAHVGNFAGTPNKVIVQRKTSADLLMIHLFIVRDFDFLSGNAVQFSLHVVTADGDKERVPLGAISKKTHDKKPKDSSGFTWFAVLGSEAPSGNVWVSITRGTVEDDGVFTPLSGEADEPYIVQIEWRSIDDGTKRRVTRGRQNGSSEPPAVARKRPAKSKKPKGMEIIKQSGGSSNADKSMEPTRAGISSDQVSPGVPDNNVEPAVPSTADGQGQAAGDAGSTKDPSLPSRLKDQDDEAQLQAGDAPSSDGAETSITSSATFIHSDKAPDLDSGTGGVPECSITGSTPTLAHKSDDTATATLKRSADEAFESDREKDLRRLEFEVAMAKADFDVDDAKAQEVTDKSSPGYFDLLLKKAKSHHAVVDAELGLKKARLDGQKDGEYRELKTRKAEAHLAVLEAEESAGARTDRLAFKLEKAKAEFKVAKAKVKKMVHGGRTDDIEILRAVLKKAQANSGVALAEFEIKAAQCGDDKETEYFQLQTRKAEAHREAVQAQRSILLRTGAL